MKKLVLYSLTLLFACALNAQTVIIYGKNASAVEKTAANDLKKDIKKVYPNEVVSLFSENQKITSKYDKKIIIGTKGTNSLVRKFVQKKRYAVLEEALKAETFILQTGKKKKKTQPFYIIGADDRGTYYGMCEFSNKVLGIDPMEYWTGKQPVAPATFEIPEISLRVKSPVFARRGYFDNDNDMLANWKGRKLIVEFDTWKEIIDALIRLRYNYIDLHDLLGRAEFWNWDYYKKMTEYHTDLELVEQVIDYAHSKGMMVQIPMYLGWEFHPIDFDKICLTKYYDEWMAIYEYYLTETPLGKADMFLQRPRHPVYDWAYKCEEEQKAGIKPGPLMTKMFKGLNDLIKKHRPEAQLVCDLWREGRPMWKTEAFQPEMDIQMLWADYYGGDFREWPEDLKGYDFGIYIHAGIWHNHVMQDPLVHQIHTAMNEAISRGMTNNVFVNGQDFKHFILNLEVCARVAWDNEAFDPDAFYTEWTSRYFGSEASPLVVNSLKMLNEAHEPIPGFKEITQMTVFTIDRMFHKDFRPFVSAKDIATAVGRSEMSLQIAQDAVALVPEASQLVYDDQIVFPATIFHKNLVFLKSVVLYCEFLKSNSTNKALNDQYAKAMKDVLIDIRQTLDNGSKWKKWDGWTKCENFRVYTPLPTTERLDELISKFDI